MSEPIFFYVCMYVFVSSGSWPIAASSIEDVSGFAFTLQSVVFQGRREVLKYKGQVVM